MDAQSTVRYGLGRDTFCNLLAAFLTTILFSISAVAGNRSAKQLGGTEANFWRLLLATLILGLLVHGAGFALSISGFGMFLFSGVIGFAVGDLALYQAFPRLGSRLTVMLVQCLATPFAAAAEWVWLGTSLSGAQIACIGLTLGGVGVALAPSNFKDTDQEHLAAGIGFGVLAAFGQGLGAVLSRKAFEITRAAGENTDGIAAAYERILGGLAVVAIWFWFEERARLRGQPTPVVSAKTLKSKWATVWPFVVLAALAGPGMGVSCFQWALKHAPAGVVLAIVATTPVVIIPFSIYLEAEKPKRRSIVGGMIAVLGAIVLATIR